VVASCVRTCFRGGKCVVGGDLGMGLMRALSRRVGFRANGGGPGNHRTKRIPKLQSASPSHEYFQLVPTAYIATAPNTAPATAPPSLGSFSEPSIMWLFDCEGPR
jgi:hypothetical protein